MCTHFRVTVARPICGFAKKTGRKYTFVIHFLLPVVVARVRVCVWGGGVLFGHDNLPCNVLKLFWLI